MQDLTLIGSGSYGMVYRKDEYAYKYIYKNNRDGTPCEGAVREIFALLHLNHPNIIKGLARYTDEDVIIRMKYYPHTFLDTLFFEGRLDRLINYLYKILHACAYMETVGFMHRDLKPENIFFNDRDVVVADFSLSVWARECNYHNVQTRYYRAPEIFAGSKYTHKADVWSIGIILYEILRGKSINLKEDPESIEILASNIGVSKSEASLFRANHNCKYPSKEYKDLWSYSNHLLGDLCARMLSFNPEYRISFAECLQHPVFKDSTKILMPQNMTLMEDVEKILRTKEQKENKDAIECLIKYIMTDEEVTLIPENDVYSILQ